MFLSNPVKAIPFVIFLSLIVGGCPWRQGPENTAVPVIAEPKSDIPFPTKEPEVFQADVVRGTDTRSELSFYARKNGKWRYDFFLNEDRRLSKLHTDKMYSVDHGKKVYAEEPVGQTSTAGPDFVNDLTFGLLHKREYSKFEDLGRDGNLRKFRVKIGDSPAGESIIYFDEALGLIVKQEFIVDGSVSFRLELKNVSLEVHDSLFKLPQGFKRISWEESLKLLKK